MTFAREASAEIELVKNHGWSFTTDGRVNLFFSIARGDGIPAGEQIYTGLNDEFTAANKIESSRARTGFIMSVLGFNLNKTLAAGVTAHARVGMWMGASSDLGYGSEPAPTPREIYLKIDAPWGSLLAGRDLSLFSRGAILLDYDIEHNYGLGHPCTTQSVSGGACGHAGFGVLFPGFHAGAVYATPEAAGLQLSAGLYDPSWLSESNYRRTPLPRAEAELTFKVHTYFRAFAGSMWQRISKTSQTTDPVTGLQNGSVDKDVDATGFNYGGMVSFGPVSLGFSGYLGKGLGLYTPLENNPVNVTAGGELRHESGYYGAGSLTFGETKLAAGLGISSLEHADDDPPDTGNNVVPKQQVGFSAGFYQGFYKTVVFALEYFQATTTWYDRGQPMGNDIVVVRSRQTVNFFNAGATLYW